MITTTPLVMRLGFVIVLSVMNLVKNVDSEEYKVLRLEDLLPSEDVTYDKSKPPTFRQHPAIVFLHITILMLDSFDQNEMTFTTGKCTCIRFRDV